MAQNLTCLGCGDYFIPDIRLSYTKPLIRDKFVRMAEADLKENNPFLYTDYSDTDLFLSYPLLIF